MIRPGAVLTLVLTFSVFVLSCGGLMPRELHPPNTDVQLVKRNYEIVKHGLKAEACKTSLLGFGHGDISYATVMRRLRDKVPEKYGADYQFVNIVEDMDLFYFLVGVQRCTVLTADVALLKEPMPDIQVVTTTGRNQAVETPADNPAMETPVMRERRGDGRPDEKSQLRKEDVSQVVCKKYIRCDISLFKNNYQTFDECRDTVTERTFDDSGCSAFNRVDASKCIDEIQQMSCGNFGDILAGKKEYPESCNKLCK